MNISRRAASRFFAASIGALAFTAAADAWPSFPIRMTVLFSAGGGTDQLAPTTK